MIRIILAGALLCVLFIPTANACDVMRPCYGNGRPLFDSGLAQDSLHSHRAAKHRAERQGHRRVPEGLQRVMAEGAGRVVAPARFIHGRLVCAVNVGMALAARGIRGTGSRLAKSYLHWGHASGPVPGAVAVFNRRGGGHVAIVHHVRPDGTVIYLNPSSRRQAWQVGPYSRKPIAFRMAGGEW